MEERQAKTGYRAVGVPSIMMVFVLLCLFALAVLSLTTALADYKLTKKTSEISAGYLIADFAAECNIYKINSTITNNNIKKLNSVKELEQLLSEGSFGVGEVFEDGENFYIVLKENVNSSLDLFVTLRLNKATGNLDVLEKQVVYTAEWQADDSLNLFIE